MAALRTAPRKIVIEPVTRVEGHGKVTILLDEENKVEQARLHIVEFRGFERFIQGRPLLGSPGAGAAAVRHLPGEPPPGRGQGDGPASSAASKLTPTAEKMRRLMHYGQMFQSHALHFFHLVLARPAVRLRRRPGDPQRHRRGRGSSRSSRCRA